MTCAADEQQLKFWRVGTADSLFSMQTPQPIRRLRYTVRSLLRCAQITWASDAPSICVRSLRGMVW